MAETSTIPQFQTMTVSELQEARWGALPAKLADLDAETREWVTAYIDAVLAHVDDTETDGVST